MWSTRVTMVKMFEEFIVGGRDVGESEPGVFIFGETLPMHEVLVALAEFVRVKDGGNGVRGSGVINVEGVRGGMRMELEGTELAMVELVRGTCCLDVATQQPDELIARKWRRSSDMRVVGASLSILGFLELGAQLVMEAIESLRKIDGGGYRGVFREARFECGVETEVGEEGGLFCGRVLAIVESELGKWQVVDPIVLLVGCIGPEVLLKHLVCTLGQTICLWVVGRRGLVIYLEQSSEFFPKMQNEYRTPV
ncbi:hypothetical protein IEO21_10100 [Rhodonia placenta]|uniref:Uncharacterized protein n=1 Tax=Rhodonia placenta TaxID=104341 RepID=A0A8H7NT90_9APHY|nr:hypothetical protein IEO21_10100 [Postia placenta]